MPRKLIFLLWLALLLAACQTTLAPDQIAGIKPAKPKAGETVTVYYQPAAKGAKLQNAGAITAHILIGYEKEQPRLLELAMQKADKLWKAEFTLPGEKPLLLLYRFAAGEKIDDRGGNSWHSLVYADGKPVKGSHLTLATLLRQQEYVHFKIAGTPEQSRKELDKELEAYPNNAQANSLLWRLQLREKPGDSTKSAIRAALETVYEANKHDEDAVATLLNWFAQTDQAARAESIRNEWMTKNPKGKLAVYQAMIKMGQQGDPGQRIAEIEQLLANDALSEEDRESLQGLLIEEYARIDRIDQAAAFLAKMDKPNAHLYNALAWPLIENGRHLPQAVELAKTGVELARRTGSDNKPSYLSQADWENVQKNALASILDTYGLGLFKTGKTAEAEAAYAEAYAVNQGDSPDINARLVESYVKNGKYDQAIEVAEACLSAAKADINLIQHFKTAWIKKNGSAAGFEAQLKKLQDLGKKQAFTKLAETRINKPAPDFTLPALNGGMVTLSEQKGKVVVVDFWATWCGPCKMSFPFLQQVYERYQKNPNVLILALNTWEREQGPQREQLVRRFINENNYTFQVLFDANYVEKFGVTGIPTKFIIDKHGQIAFQSIGFNGGEEMIQEMTAEIDLLLAE
ncbi:MAG TPA: redoxin domain-containing protein [bacterium]|nr:redoxin domain-containing protein [bacterium]HPN34696.1 redoxin domain-containing protein [bacterium]